MLDNGPYHANSIKLEGGLTDWSLPNSMVISGIALDIQAIEANMEAGFNCPEINIDSEAVCSNENDVCESDTNFVPDPRRFGLTDDYIYVEQEWGSLFYKHVGKKNRRDAEKICSDDGAHLPFPRFAEEQEFYKVHFGDESLWLDVYYDEQSSWTHHTQGSAKSLTNF